MESLKFDEGYKEYMINDDPDRVIRINPSDLNMWQRCMDEMEKLGHVKDAVPVLKRGCVNVICQNGTPVAGGKVYVRTVKNESYPNAAVGGFEAAEDTGKNVELTNAQWKGSADANGVAEMRILTILNA